MIKKEKFVNQLYFNKIHFFKKEREVSVGGGESEKSEGNGEKDGKEEAQKESERGASCSWVQLLSLTPKY